MTVLLSGSKLTGKSNYSMDCYGTVYEHGEPRPNLRIVPMNQGMLHGGIFLDEEDVCSHFVVTEAWNSGMAWGTTNLDPGCHESDENQFLEAPIHDIDYIGNVFDDKACFIHRRKNGWRFECPFCGRAKMYSPDLYELALAEANAHKCESIIAYCDYRHM